MNSTTTSSRSAVASALSSLLPADLSISLYHIATSPGKTKPLFTPSPGKKPTSTTLESHFIATSHQDVLVFAIELLVYTLVTSGERIIFISKADSSGYLPPSAASYFPAHAPDTRVSLLRSIAETAVRVILEGARTANPASKITVSLFARSQTQYLFPNSGANATKHVLEDRGLIAWWCRVLDPVLQRYAVQGAKAHLLVPGFDKLQTRKLFPPRKGVDEARWTCGHPLVADPERDITVREIIPHFPDDPKARFLHELNGDESGKKGAQRGKRWNSIRSVDDFWEMMSMRQECSLGRCVGFIWVVIRGEPTPGSTQTLPSGDSAEPENTQSSQSDSQGTQESTQESAQLTSSQSTQPGNQLSLDTQLPIASQEDDSPNKSPKKRFRPDAISILMSPRKKKHKAFDSDSLLPGSKPPLVSSAVVLDEKRYQRTIDSLLNHTDFGTVELAKDGTRKWVQRSYAVVKASDAIIKDGWDWGEVVTGTMERAAEQPKEEKAKPPGVNVLLGRRKGSDVPDVLSAGLARKEEEGLAEAAPTVNVLGAGQVRGEERMPVNVLVARKREKPAAAKQRANAADLSESARESEGVVNVLGAGLVRRKPKAGDT